MSDSNARGSWLVTFGLVLLNLAAMGIVAPMIAGIGWFFAAAIGVTAVLVAVEFVRHFTGRLWLGSLTGLVGLVVAILITAQPSSPLRILSTPITRMAEFGEQMLNDQPPLRDTLQVSMLMCGVCIALALVAETLAQVVRAPSFAPLALLPHLVIPVTVGLPPAPWYAWVLVLLALVLYLYFANRWLQHGDDETRAALGFTADGRGTGGLTSALVTGGAAVLVAALVATLLPPTSGAWWGMFNATASLSTNRVNPIIDLGDDLRRGRPIDILHYATSQTSGRLPYISLTTLTGLDEETEWVPGDFTGTRPVRDGRQPRDRDLQRGANTLELNANIVLEEGVTAYLPHIGTPRDLQNLSGTYLRDQETGDMREADDRALAQSVQVFGVVPRPDDTQLAAATLAVPPQLESYTELPDDPAALAQIRAAMEQVIDPNLGPYAQAQQLQQWFTGGAFDYSEQAPVRQGYDGTSLEVITRFLQVRAGYCVHFSSAMAVMGRLLGIPTRIQVGFTPGTQSSTNDIGQAVFDVTTDDLHAWAELWVPGYGWVPFDTTPSDGTNQPSLASTTPTDEPAPTVTADPVAPTPTPDTTPTPTSASGPTPTPTSETDAAEQDGAAATGPDLAGILRVLGIIAAVLAPLLVLVLLVFAPLLVRRVRRARRERDRKSVV